MLVVAGHEMLVADSPQAGLKHFPSASTACTSGSASQHSSSANSHNSSSHSIDLHGGDGDGHEAAAADATTSSTAVKGIATVAAVAAVADCGVHLATPPRRSHPEKEKEQHVEQGQGAEDVGCWLKMSSTSTEKSGVTERSERSIVGELDN